MAASGGEREWRSDPGGSTTGRAFAGEASGRADGEGGTDAQWADPAGNGGERGGRAWASARAGYVGGQGSWERLKEWEETAQQAFPLGPEDFEEGDDAWGAGGREAGARTDPGTHSFSIREQGEAEEWGGATAPHEGGGACEGASPGTPGVSHGPTSTTDRAELPEVIQRDPGNPSLDGPTVPEPRDEGPSPGQGLGRSVEEVEGLEPRSQADPAPAPSTAGGEERIEQPPRPGGAASAAPRQPPAGPDVEASGGSRVTSGQPDKTQWAEKPAQHQRNARMGGGDPAHNDQEQRRPAGGQRPLAAVPMQQQERRPNQAGADQAAGLQPPEGRSFPPAAAPSARQSPGRAAMTGPTARRAVARKLALQTPSPQPHPGEAPAGYARGPRSPGSPTPHRQQMPLLSVQSPPGAVPLPSRGMAATEFQKKAKDFARRLSKLSTLEGDCLQSLRRKHDLIRSGTLTLENYRSFTR